ncbi:hypothetical protein [uncultured Bacteroides sp.]|uniref:hypothetical protein n=1 Tax=uncultured Bacteroides sp. TaxID=162156 RepID=UPI002627D10E|nr:hypothetical protein [uncultured Bacteroides sp.]
MKRNLFISVFTAFFMLVTVSVFAQERATGKDYKELKKNEKVLDKELKKKAIKAARKEAKRLTKEGFKTPVGKLPLDKQIETAWEKQAELDMDGNPYWYIASSRAIGGNQSAAVLQATNAAKIDLAGQIQTKVSQLIEAKVANDDMGQEEAASLSSVVAASKSVISATLGRTIPLVEVYRTLENKNVEVMVTLGYSMQAANQAAISAIRKELAGKSEELAKELDKLGY